MRRVLILVALLVPLTTFSEGGIDRLEGFLRIWDSVQRPADSTRESPFADVPDGSYGFNAITYAKARGLLDDTNNFYPDGELILDDALIWLFRTRNVRKWDQMNLDDLPSLLSKYPVVNLERLKSEEVITEDALQELITTLDTLLREEVHEASLYAENFHGDGTAFGESFDMHALTAAHRTLPHNTLVKVTNVENGKSVTVRINDRGPFVEGRDMDLSLAAFTTIADRSRGKIDVRFDRLGDASMVASENTEANESVQDEENIESVSENQPAVAPPFNDVPQDHPYREGIEYVRNKAIVSGYSDGSFKPNTALSRVEFIKMVTGPKYTQQELRECMLSGLSLYSDTDVSQWYAPYVCIAKKNGLINGYPDGTFKPQQEVIFVEAAKIISLLYGKITPQQGEKWFAPSVAYLSGKKAIPFSVNRLDTFLTRGELAEIIWRLEENKSDQPSASYDSSQNILSQ